MKRLLLALLVTVSSGCGAIDRIDDALYAAGLDAEPSAARLVAREGGVTVLAGDRKGRGAIVGPRTVVTVAHVVGREEAVEVSTGLSWTTAKVVARVPASPEALVVLELETSAGLLGFEGFPEERRLAPGDGAPAWVLASSGLHGWARGLRPGDSGSPVIDARGALVGVLVGVTTTGRGVLTPVTSTPASCAVVARLLSTRR